MDEDRKHDSIVIFLALLSVTIVSGLGAGILAHFSTPTLLFQENLNLAAYLRLCGVVVGRFAGDIFCGMLLGARLRTISPWRVSACFVTGLGVYAIAFHVIARSDRSGMNRIGGGILHVSLVMLAASGYIAVGIWCGRRWFTKSRGSSCNSMQERIA